MHVHVSLHRRESIRWTSHSPISVVCFSMARSGFYQVSKRRGRMRSSVFYWQLSRLLPLRESRRVDSSKQCSTSLGYAKTILFQYDGLSPLVIRTTQNQERMSYCSPWMLTFVPDHSKAISPKVATTRYRENALAAL
jgi:hypothetical protein